MTRPWTSRCTPSAAWASSHRPGAATPHRVAGSLSAARGGMARRATTTGGTSHADHQASRLGRRQWRHDHRRGSRIRGRTRERGAGTTIYAYINGEFAGDGRWYQDPTDARKGDTVCAEDGTGDGYYIRAELAVGLSANTNHDTAPAVHCNTQNLPEGHTFNMRVCVVKGEEAICSRWYSVTA